MASWRVKDNSVKVVELNNEIINAIEVTAEVYEEYGFELVVTSARDGKHMSGSKHYDGDAFDARIWGIGEAGLLKKIANKIARILGDDFDVVLEGNHYHIEYDPK